MQTVFELILNGEHSLGVVETEWLDDLKVVMYDVARQTWGWNSVIQFIPDRGEVPFFVVNRITNETITALVRE